MNQSWNECYIHSDYKYLEISFKPDINLLKFTNFEKFVSSLNKAQ